MANPAKTKAKLEKIRKAGAGRAPEGRPEKREEEQQEMSAGQAAGQFTFNARR